MEKRLGEFIKDKKVLILGFGREGKSTFRILSELGTYTSVAISDMNQVVLPDCDDVETIYGERYLDVIDNYDIVFKSPGIVLPKPACEYNCLITSQAEQFLISYASKTIGITGTKGKSTTSTLLYHTLSNNGIDTILAGNIGIPVFDIVENITDKTVVVMEMSCHQLEYIDTAPSTAVYLNLFEDHLDHYGDSFERYAYAKQNIYRRQKPGDKLFCHPDFMPDKGDCSSDIHPVCADVLPAIAAETTKLKGKHNLFNIAVVYEISKSFGISDEDFLASLATFSPLAHRLEHVGCIDGVDYYDDSISTTAESTVSAINSIENAGSVLIGGMDRGIDYTGLIAFLLDCKLDEVICMYESGKRIYDAIPKDRDSSPRFSYFPDLYAAVEYAKKVTPEGKACILSPSAASYGYFKNFEERGDVFKRIVKEQV